MLAQSCPLGAKYTWPSLPIVNNLIPSYLPQLQPIHYIIAPFVRYLYPSCVGLHNKPSYGKLIVQIKTNAESCMAEKPIPDIVIGRLPIYLRALQHMKQESRQVTSSQELGERLGISAAQIRKDLSQFGEFGKQGTGYNIDFLAKKLQEILHMHKVWDVAIVGAGDIGSALARYQGFSERGFEIKLIFDNNPAKVGTQIDRFTIRDSVNLASDIAGANIKIAMISVPANQAQDVADQLVSAGVKSILNYAPVSLTVPLGVHVQYIDPVVHLQRMTYYLD
ncbi:MAG: redox-sensing transcriptional repressor Rex [Chloroflexi bacterium]|nr:redox-sensing transcriptional repressor Rex [Chloroflexota bacterium]